MTVKDMKEIDIYDFDKTVVPFDSGSKFWFYCLVRNPWIVFCSLYQGIRALPFVLGLADLDSAKKELFCFVRFINLEKNVKKFWDKYEKTVFEWFRKANRERPAVVISASPDFLLEEICSRLEVETLICTRHDRKTGTLIGRNCKGEEKVIRFNQQVSHSKVINVYSDSLKSDKPIFSLGERCFHIQPDGERRQFEFAQMYK